MNGLKLMGGWPVRQRLNPRLDCARPSTEARTSRGVPRPRRAVEHRERCFPNGQQTRSRWSSAAS